MKKAEFEQYYDTILLPLMESQVECNNAKGERFKEIAFRDAKWSIYEEYQNQKTAFRLLYDKDVPKKTDRNQLHRHKVCACLTVAIIKSRPLFVVDGFPDDDEFDFASASSINEQLALSAGLSLLRAYVLEDPSDSVRRKYFETVDFFVPKAFKHDDTSNQSFDTMIIWSLYDANVLNGLSAPLLADLFFMFDRYHELFSKYQEIQARLR